jgi:hypothetical protein
VAASTRLPVSFLTVTTLGPLERSGPIDSGGSFAHESTHGRPPRRGGGGLARPNRCITTKSIMVNLENGFSASYERSVHYHREPRRATMRWERWFGARSTAIETLFRLQRIVFPEGRRAVSWPLRGEVGGVKFAWPLSERGHRDSTNRAKSLSFFLVLLPSVWTRFGVNRFGGGRARN